MNLAENLAGSAARARRRRRDQARRRRADLHAARRGRGGVANLLAEKGVEAGDRVGIMLPNVPYFPVCLLRRAASSARVVVPMNVLLKKREVGFYLTDPEAKVLFAWHDFAEAAEAGADEAGAELILVKPGEFEELVGAPRRTPSRSSTATTTTPR